MRNSVVGFVLCMLVSSVTDAGTAGLTGIWAGEYVWADLGPGGGCDFCPNIAQPWVFDFDNGTVEMVNTVTIFGAEYTFHDTAFTDNGEGTYSGLILLDVISGTYEYYDVHIDILWDITDTGQVSTLDGSIRYDSPWFPNSNMTFNGYLNPIPIPPAFWLFGSGLVGLVGVARRKKA